MDVVCQFERGGLIAIDHGCDLLWLCTRAVTHKERTLDTRMHALAAAADDVEVDETSTLASTSTST